MAVYTFHSESFKEDVLENEKIVLVDFWASWCGPCRLFSPVIEAVADKYPDEIVVGRVNVDEEKELAKEYQVNSIPTVIVFKDGKETTRSVGYIGEEELSNLFL